MCCLSRLSAARDRDGAAERIGFAFAKVVGRNMNKYRLNMASRIPARTLTRNAEFLHSVYEGSPRYS